jgi:dynein intermediate chain 1
MLTAEEKEANIIKTLNANNPLAPHNLTKYSFKDRAFKTEDTVDQLVFHFQFDGDVVLKDSDEARDQEEYWENKKKGNKSLLDKMNIAIKEEFGKDPRKLLSFKFKFENIVEGNDRAQKKSLRNQFNFQERASQTFNLPLREKGIKTDPPQCSTFSLETTQW